MNLLALDSSTPVTSVAVVSIVSGAARIVFEENTLHPRSDSSSLFNALNFAVASCGKPDALCVGLGPGSYNGIRASVAVAMGFSTALTLPLHALPSPLAIEGPESGFWAVGDARGGHYWIALVRQGAFLEEPRLLPPEKAVAHASTQDLPVFSATPLAGFGHIETATPSAVRIAMLAQESDSSYLVTVTPEPLYLKPPHITAPKAHPLSR